MPTQRSLAGAAHDIAHHAASGLSYITPYLGQALLDAGLSTTTFSIMESNPYPSGIAKINPLRLSLQALSSTAEKIIQGYGFSKDDITAIDLFASPAPWDETGYSLHTRAVITVCNGKSFDSGWLQ
jgi:hypothetical protein